MPCVCVAISHNLYEAPPAPKSQSRGEILPAFISIDYQTMPRSGRLALAARAQKRNGRVDLDGKQLGGWMSCCSIGLADGSQWPQPASPLLAPSATWPMVETRQCSVPGL